MSSNDNVQQVQIYIFSADFRNFLERSPKNQKILHYKKITFHENKCHS